MTSTLRFPRGLYGITPEWDDTDQLIHALEQAAAGGMVALQWRRKTASPQGRLDQARRVSQRCRELGVVFIVNDDWRLASMIDADGVHLGREDGDPVEVRQALGPHKIMGSSCYNDLELARRALAADVDYIAFGSVYASQVKPDAIRASLATVSQGLALARSAVSGGLRAAIVAIGGITPENLPPVIAAGADSAALISGLFGAPDIQTAASSCTALFQASLAAQR